MIIRMVVDDCYWVNWEKRIFSGFTLPGADKVMLGDELQCDMQSKQVARFKVKKVQYLPDLRKEDGASQYVGEAKDIAYAPA